MNLVESLLDVLALIGIILNMLLPEKKASEKE